MKNPQANDLSTLRAADWRPRLIGSTSGRLEGLLGRQIRYQTRLNL